MDVPRPTIRLFGITVAPYSRADPIKLSQHR